MQEIIMLGKEVEKTLKEVKNTIDFLVSKYQGKNYSRFIKIYCPFHKETVPSLYVHKTKLLFHCFGCNVSGTIFDLINIIKKGILNDFNFHFDISKYITDFTFENYNDPILSKVMERKKISPIFYIEKDYSKFRDYFIYANDLIYDFIKKIHLIHKKECYYKIENLLFSNNITYDLFLKFFPYTFITNYDFKFESHYKEIVDLLDKVLINNYLTIPLIKNNKIIGFIQRRINDNSKSIKYNYIFVNEEENQKYFLIKSIDSYSSKSISICEGIFDMLHILTKHKNDGIIVSTIGTNNLNIDWEKLVNGYRKIKIYGDYDLAGLKYVNYLNKEMKEFKKQKKIENFYILKKKPTKNIIKRKLKKKNGGAL
jgi:hypothetical protein